jgi:CxxC motif-containing protein (DUF1111 family)
VKQNPCARSITAVIGAATLGLLALQVDIASQTRTAAAAKDPGVRAGAAAAGAPLPGLTSQQMKYFNASKEDFEEVESIEDGIGPRMNLDSCVGCHAQPATGGSSPAVNPQMAMASAYDKMPSFLTANGPVREARFVRNKDGSADGGVHALFTISGRGIATSCTITQPDFETEVANRNVIFRIPTPVFGAGLIEQIPDAAILANKSSNASAKSSLGIRGRANFVVAGRAITGQSNSNGNDGTLSRFGWKAQNKSLLLFAGEAYNVEMGISNELFQTERDETGSCQYAATPNSIGDTETLDPVAAMTSIEKFAFFMRMLAPPAPSTTTPGGAGSITSGKAAFNSVGCAFCHTPSFTTGKSALAPLSGRAANLYSDLLVHDMGSGLADGVSQGQAGPREFRTAPLWGLGQRIFFLHDGRASDLLEAIRAHASAGSEANGVVARFLQLSEAKKQDLLNFLRSL